MERLRVRGGRGREGERSKITNLEANLLYFMCPDNKRKVVLLEEGMQSIAREHKSSSAALVGVETRGKRFIIFVLVFIVDAEFDGQQ